jgi:hypothetical protein
MRQMEYPRMSTKRQKGNTRGVVYDVLGRSGCEKVYGI